MYPVIIEDTGRAHVYIKGSSANPSIFEKVTRNVTAINDTKIVELNIEPVSHVTIMPLHNFLFAVSMEQKILRLVTLVDITERPAGFIVDIPEVGEVVQIVPDLYTSGEILVLNREGKVYCLKLHQVLDNKKVPTFHFFPIEDHVEEEITDLVKIKCLDFFPPIMKLSSIRTYRQNARQRDGICLYALTFDGELIESSF